MCINQLENDEDSKNVPYHVIAWIISWTSVFINPLIYGFSNKTFQKGLKKAVLCDKEGVSNGLQSDEWFTFRTLDLRAPRTPNTQPKCLRTLDGRTSNRTTNGTPNRTPNIQLRFTQYQSHFYLPSPSQIEPTH